MSGFTPKDLCTQIADTRLWKGFDCLQLGQITAPDVQRDGTLITTLVRGSAARPHRVYVRLAPGEDGAPLIKGQCTCHNAPNCEHVAAALMHVLSAESDLLGEVPEMLSFEHWREWINETGVSRDTHTEQTPALLYVLYPGEGPALPWPAVVTLRAWRRASGQYHALRSLDPARTLAADAASFLAPQDRLILDSLATQEPVEDGDGQLLKGRSGAALLEAMIATGRCHLYAHDTAPLRQARGQQRATCAWDLDQAGDQRIAWHSDREGQIVLPLAPPWYVDPEKSTSGPLDTGLPDTVLSELVHLPSVAPGKIGELTQRLRIRYPQYALPAPREIESLAVRSGDPVPVLTLATAFDELDGESRPEPAGVSTAVLSFDYAGLQVRGQDSNVLAHDGRLFHIARRQLLEQRHRQHLQRLGLDALDDSVPSRDSPAHGQDVYGLPHADAWVALVVEVIPELEAAGWRVEIADEFHYRPLEVEQWNMDVQRCGIDGLSLDLSAQAGGTTVHLLPAIVAVLRELPRQDARAGLDAFPDNKPIVFAREKGGLISITLGRIRAIVAVLLELYEEGALDSDGRLPLHRPGAARLPELEAVLTDAEVAHIGLEEPHLIGERLRAVNSIATVEPPRGLRATLRAYQQRGLDWLQFLREGELGGVLADDMGLGKTVQTLAHLLVEKQSGRMDRPCLVIAPTSLMVNWRREAARFAPDLRVLTLHGPRRREEFEAIRDHDLVLTTYPLLSRDEEALLAHDYHVVVLDEAQTIKNPKTKARQIAAQLTARQRLCLTGTPMENHLGELWSLFDFALPGYLGNQARFRRLFRTPIEQDSDADRQTLLGRRIAPFMLRRTKEAVVQELPAKTEILRTVELAGDQRELYESIRLSVEERVRKEIAQKGLARSQIMILDALLKLRQTCCDPRLVKIDSAAQVERSAKFELLMELLPEMVEEGRRVLLFSQFTSMLRLIADGLKSTGLDYVQLTGRTRDRKTPVDRFQNGEVPIFLISLKAGGVGLNLTAADSVIHYDPWWNPAVETQATDRAHRIGQDKPVFVYKLITEGSVEERIQELQERKRALIEGVLGNRRNAEPQWSAEDLEMLLQPLD